MPKLWPSSCANVTAFIAFSSTPANTLVMRPAQYKCNEKEVRAPTHVPVAWEAECWNIPEANGVVTSTWTQALIGSEPGGGVTIWVHCPFPLQLSKCVWWP